MDVLTRDDIDPPTLAAFADDPEAPPTVSERRMQALCACGSGKKYKKCCGLLLIA
jgi:hypothetical protein